MTGADPRAAKAEVEAAIRRAFFYAGFADKFDGAVHATRSRFVTLAMNEPWGVMGIVCPNEAPLIGFVSLVMPAIAMGNCVVAVPSSLHPLSATDLYTVLDASDVPAGVVNIVTGDADAALDDARRARRGRRALVRGRRCGRGQSRGALGRQSQGDMGSLRPGWTGRGRRGGSSCVGRPRSRTSGRPTASETHHSFVTV